MLPKANSPITSQLLSSVKWYTLDNRQLKSLSRSWLFVTPWTVAPPGSSVHGDSPGKDTGVGCQALIQGIFPIQDQTHVSYIAGGFFTNWATREAQ